MNPWLLLLIASVLLAIIVVLVSMLVRGNRQEEGEPVEGYEAEITAESDIPAPVSRSRMSTAQSTSTPSLLSITRGWDNDWEIRVQGRKINALADVQDATVRKNVMEAIKALVGMARNYAQGGKAEPAKPAPSPTIPSTITERVQHTYTSQRVVSGSVPLGSIDLAKEIGEIVDELLKSDPILRNHRVQLINEPGGGIKFIFNGQSYTELDEIPNDGVKETIRKATAEWNRR